MSERYFCEYQVTYQSDGHFCDDYYGSLVEAISFARHLVRIEDGDVDKVTIRRDPLDNGEYTELVRTVQEGSL